MGLREKVTIVFLIVLFLQITARLCMPKNINTVPLRNSKRLKKILQSPTANNILEQYYKKSNPMLETNKGNVKMDRDSSKLSKSILNELIKSIKSKHGDPTETNKESPNFLLKPFATTPQPYCFKEIGTFPEVEYPMFVTDTWTPKYWKKLPDSQQNVITNSGSYVTSKTETEETKYIKPSNKAIEKAVKALIKYKEKTGNLNTDSVHSTKTEPDSSTCPVNPPAQCLPSDEPKIKNTTIAANKLSLSEYFDPHPVYGTYTFADHDTSKEHLISSSSPVPRQNIQLIDQPKAALVNSENINQLNYPTELASEYLQESNPVAAMPPLPSSSGLLNSQTNEIVDSAQPIAPMNSMNNIPNTLIDDLPNDVIDPSKTLDTQTRDVGSLPVPSIVDTNESIVTPNNDVINPTNVPGILEDGTVAPFGAVPADSSILGANSINPAETLIPSATGINNPNELLYAPDNQIDILTKVIEEPTGSLAEQDTGSLSELLPTPTITGATAGITDTSAPVTKIYNPEMFNSIIPSEEPIFLSTKPISSPTSSNSSMLSSADTMASVLSSSGTSYSESNSDLGTNDYEFATMPPFLISYDTSENMPDPDDSSSKFSPGDLDYILV